MKFILSYSGISALLCFSMPTSTHAKYGQSHFQRPCQLLEIKIKSCQQKTFNSKQFDTWRNRFFGAKKYSKTSGTIVVADVISSKHSPCFPEHKSDSNLFKPYYKKTGRFFIENESCTSLQQNKRPSKVLARKLTCDTPNAIEIEDCFFQAIQEKYDLVFTSVKINFFSSFYRGFDMNNEKISCKKESKNCKTTLSKEQKNYQKSCERAGAMSYLCNCSFIICTDRINH